MKLKFKKQSYQTNAVETGADLEAELKVSPMQYTVVAGEQLEAATYDGIRQGESFKAPQVKYDVVDGFGKLMALVAA